jgi:hypothetical protein
MIHYPYPKSPLVFVSSKGTKYQDLNIEVLKKELEHLQTKKNNFYQKLVS